MGRLNTVIKETKTGEGFYDQALDAYIVSVVAGVYNWSKSSNIAFSTMLGSCLSVCAYDLHAGVGGMNHFLLPEAPEDSEENDLYSSSFRYGSAAIETLLNSLYKHGAAKNGIQVKIFGGGKILHGVSRNVGERNIEFARRFFKRENMRIESEDVGGMEGRRIIFFPKTGKVLLRTFASHKDMERLAKDEVSAMNSILEKGDENNVELF